MSSPRALLVEHPTLPRPFEGAREDHRSVRVADLDEAGRWRIAAQMLAVTGLLADVELWPCRWAMRRADVEITEHGPQLRLPALPVPLSRIWSKLGGGDLAAERVRSGVLAEVAAVTGLDIAAGGDLGYREPGFFLDGVLDRLLDTVGRPLDLATARCLWLWRWSLPEPPDPGDTALLAVPDESVARRIAAATWAAARRRGLAASLEGAGTEVCADAAVDRSGTFELRVIVGSFDEETLTGLVDRSDDGRTATAVIGRFPEGWNAVPAPIVGRSGLSSHLSVIGLPPHGRARVVDGLAGRFDPFSAADRQRLTETAAVRYTPQCRRRSPARGELARVAGLSPDGVPVELALELAGVDRTELRTARDDGTVLVRDGTAMLPHPRPLSVDPRHGDIAGIHDDSDPRRALHLALAAGDPGKLLSWARTRLDDLDPVPVRRLLSQLAPGVLGAGVQALLAEACLGLADVHGARGALDRLDRELARPWLSWLRLLDRSPEREVQRPSAAERRIAPRACAEVELVRLRRAMERNGDADQDAVAGVRAAITQLAGANRRWIEIRLAARVDPGRLDDRGWRRAMTAGHPQLIGLVLFERSLRAILDGNRRLARRLLNRVMAAEHAPGRLALMKVNLGGIEADEGRHEGSEALTLSAFRLFQAAGFKQRLWDALYNLAVADVDQLRVERAAARLGDLARTNDSSFVTLERARLDLAIGDLESFHSRVSGLPPVNEPGVTQVAQAVAFLRGAQALLVGDSTAALALLRGGGQEGLTWAELAEAVTGCRRSGRPSSADGWGVLRAAELIRRVREHGSPDPVVTLADTEHGLRDAVAVALCHELGACPGWPGGAVRERAARVLCVRGLTGWASRLRWSRTTVDGLLSGLSALIRGPESIAPGSAVAAGMLATVGAEGLVIRDRDGDRELLRLGDGEPGESVRRGCLDVMPLGSGTPDGPAWQLLLDVVDLMSPEERHRDDGSPDPEVRIDGVSRAVARLRDEVLQVARPRFTVLILGETGTGKEVVAREVHRLSRRDGDLVSVNVAAIPPNLLDAELFGSVKGAFTGADRSRRGLAVSADRGTLFLDEVGDLDLALQVKLLRFLESGEVRAVGADRTRRLDVRVICATHRNLDRMVREGRFRSDLFYRIAVAKLRIPALRERPEDIPVLRSIFEREASRQHGLPLPSWTAEAERRLLRHTWPGNVRELKHTVEVAMARSVGGRVRPEDIPLGDLESASRGSWEGALGEFKRRLLTEVLHRHRGNRSAAARELGISRQALLYQLKTLGLTHL